MRTGTLLLRKVSTCLVTMEEHEVVFKAMFHCLHRAIQLWGIFLCLWRYSNYYLIVKCPITSGWFNFIVGKCCTPVRKLCFCVDYGKKNGDTIADMSYHVVLLLKIHFKSVLLINFQLVSFWPKEVWGQYFHLHFSHP